MTAKPKTLTYEYRVLEAVTCEGQVSGPQEEIVVEADMPLPGPKPVRVSTWQKRERWRAAVGYERG